MSSWRTDLELTSIVWHSERFRDRGSAQADLFISQCHTAACARIYVLLQQHLASSSSSAAAVASESAAISAVVSLQCSPPMSRAFKFSVCRFCFSLLCPFLQLSGFPRLASLWPPHQFLLHDLLITAATFCIPYWVCFVMFIILSTFFSFFLFIFCILIYVWWSYYFK